MRSPDLRWTDRSLVLLYADSIEPFFETSAEWIIVVAAGRLKV